MSLSAPVSWETQAGVFLTGLDLLAEARCPMLESSTQSSSLQAVPSASQQAGTSALLVEGDQKLYRRPSGYRATLLLQSF